MLTWFAGSLDSHKPLEPLEAPITARDLTLYGWMTWHVPEVSRISTIADTMDGEKKIVDITRMPVWCALPAYLEDGAYFCYCAYVLRISKYFGFLWVVPTNTVEPRFNDMPRERYIVKPGYLYSRIPGTTILWENF